MVTGCLVDRQRQVGVELAEKKPRALVLVDHICVLANPADTSFFRERFFEYRRAVDERAIAELANPLLNAFRQFLQFVAHQLVIVAAEGIARDVGERVMIQQLAGLLLRLRQVIHAHRNHADRAGHQLAGATAFAAMARHVLH